MTRPAWLLFASAVAVSPLAARAAGPAPSPVRVAKVQQRTIVPTVPVAGTIQNKNDQQITAGIDGQIVSVAEPGAVLKAAPMPLLTSVPASQTSPPRTVIGAMFENFPTASKI